MGGTTIRTDGFLSRLVAAGWVPWFYLYEVFLPFNLTVIYPQWHIDASRWIAYIPGMALVGCCALFWWKRETWGRPWLFALGYFVVMLFPVLGFFDQGFYRYSLVADHWQYYSIVGAIALTVAAGLTVCRQLGKWGRAVGVLASVAVLVTLGAATWARARVYTDSQTLWRDNLTKNPNAALAHYNLGNALADQGKVQEAVQHYEQALRLKPDYTDAHHNLGNALRQVGRAQDAIGHYEEVLRIQPDDADAHYNLALAFRQVGQLDEAIHHDERAVQIKPDFAVAHYNLGNVLVQAGRVQDGIGHYEQALRIQPDYAEAHNNLGVALLQLRRSQEAMGHFEQAVRIKPDYAEAHYNLAIALVQTGRIQDAIWHFEQALRIQPDFAAAKTDLANAQATQQRAVPSRR
jgi:tetratricopeptide (TPR) repeat protein